MKKGNETTKKWCNPINLILVVTVLVSIASTQTNYANDSGQIDTSPLTLQPELQGMDNVQGSASGL